MKNSFLFKSYIHEIYFLKLILHRPFHQVPFEGHGFAFPYKIM